MRQRHQRFDRGSTLNELMPVLYSKCLGDVMIQGRSEEVDEGTSQYEIANRATQSSRGADPPHKYLRVPMPAHLGTRPAPTSPEQDRPARHLWILSLFLSLSTKQQTSPFLSEPAPHRTFH
ncbi:hypothetical protein TgHK011_006647 [Trichoderma gracile]|nr:hypothetical protein TgHK011_006647 [Trichoderma gracile]